MRPANGSTGSYRRLLEPIGNIPPAEAEEHERTTAYVRATHTKQPPANPARFTGTNHEVEPIRKFLPILPSTYHALDAAP